MSQPSGFRNFLFFLFAAAAAVPGIYVRLFHVALPPEQVSIVSGMAIMGSAFLLLWACDAAQVDVSQALALAVVALIAVLPEYAVDMYFTWEAGKLPASSYSQYAIANMTGANRLLIGVAWVLIVIVSWMRTRKPVTLEKERRLEVNFLNLATMYALLIPIKGTLTWFDGVVFLLLYGWYISIVAQRPSEEEEPEGPAELLFRLPPSRRRAATILLFLYAGIAILANAEPFCEGLVATGKKFGVNEFLLVQWLAPIASETPEFVVALVFAFRGQAGTALGSLLAAKLNQWTLLVGMIPGVFALSSGSLAQPIPFNHIQIHEILLTAAQSLLAVAILSNLTLTIRHAFLLFILFAGQLVSPQLVEMMPSDSFLGFHDIHMHQVFSLLYLMAALTLFIEHPQRFSKLFNFRDPVRREKTENISSSWIFWRGK